MDNKIKDNLNKISSAFYRTQWSIEQWFEDRKYFLRNVKRFHKMLYKFRPWDYQYAIDMFVRSLEILRDSIAKGCEVEYSRNKKVKKMTELIDLLNTHIDDIDIDSLVDDKLTGTERMKAIDNLYHQHFQDIFRLIEGQPDDEFMAKYNKLKEDFEKDNPGKEPNPWDLADVAKDGSGILNWWC